MSWYGTVVLMLLVIGGIETNPGPRGVVSDENPNVAKAGNVETESSSKRPLELVSLPSKKQRVTERKPTIAQLILALSQIKLKAQIETPLHLLKPHSLPLFTEVCDILKIPNTRKFMDRTKYIWKEYIKANEKNSICSVEKDRREMLTDLKPSECKQRKNESPNEKDDSLPTLHEPNRSLSTDNLLCHVNWLSKHNEVFYREDNPEEAVTHQDANLPEMSKNIASEIASKEIPEKRIVYGDQPLLEVERTSNESLVLNRDVTEMETEVQSIEFESSINTETCVKPHQDVGFWEFWITAEDWRKVHLGNGKYSWFTIRELIKLTAAPVFKICLICFKTHRTNKVKKGEPVIVYYGKCKHEGCRQFRFELIPVDDAIKLTVSANGEIRHKEKLSSRLSGLERIAAKQVLLTKKALAFRSEKILKAEAKTVLAGNLLEIRSLDVFRQARAEAAKMSDRHNDDGIDLLMRFREDRQQDGNNIDKFGGVDELIDAEKNLVNEERIIQKVGEPLHVYMFSVLQLKTLLHSLGKRGKTCILHIDSTGSVVRPLKGDKKTVYYYSGCVNVGGKLLPVMDFISCQHDVASITSFFIQFVQFQKKNFGSKRIFSHIVTDFSTALLPAVILAWNRMSVLSYLIKMFRLCTKTEYQIKGIVTKIFVLPAEMVQTNVDISGANVVNVEDGFIISAWKRHRPTNGSED